MEQRIPLASGGHMTEAKAGEQEALFLSLAAAV